MMTRTRATRLMLVLSCAAPALFGATGALAQNVTTSGSLGQIGGTTCNAVYVPSECATESVAILAPVNAPSWSHGGSQPGVLIGANLSNSNTGPAATGAASVTGGGTARTGRVWVGFEGNTSGSVTIAGAGSNWTAGGIGVIGQYGRGSLRIEDGGFFSSTNSYVGLMEGAQGDVLISGIAANGMRSTWESRSNALYLAGSWFGDAPTGRPGGTATVTVADGGLVTTTGGGVFVGQAVGGTATLNVSGIHASGVASAVVTTGQFVTGNYGNGITNISDGGLVQSASGYIGGALRTGASTNTSQPDPTMGRGVVNVSGVNANGTASTWRMAGLLAVGNYGTGNLNISAGGKVSSGAGSVVGARAGSVGGVMIAGPGSTWTAGGALVIGDLGAGAVTVADDGVLAADSLTLAAQAGSTGLLSIGNGGAAGSVTVASITGGAGDATVRFNHNEILAFGTPMLGTLKVHHAGSGTTVFTRAQNYSGTTTIDAGTLAAGADNVFSPLSRHIVNRGGTLDLRGFDQTIAALDNGGLVSFGSVPGTRLAVTGDYSGRGGTLAMSSVLGDDNSVTDRLIVGGSASGRTAIEVTNVGGAGAQTAGDGIKLVDVAGTSTADAFALADGPLIASAYRYDLYRGGVSAPNDQDWYLRSSLRTIVPPSISVLRTTQSLGLASLGTLNERVGEEAHVTRQGDGTAAAPAGLWGRVFGSHYTDTTGSAFGNTRANGQLGGAQMGLDIYRGGEGDTRTIVGILGGRVWAGTSDQTDVPAAPRAYTGRTRSDGWMAGAYLTHFGKGGWYVDAVVQGNWLDHRASATDGTKLETKSDGWLASLEFGQPISLGSDWRLEPQFQLIYSAFDIDDTTDSAGIRNDFHLGDSLTGRAGFRLKRTWDFDGSSDGGLFTAYLKANMWGKLDGGRPSLDVGGNRSGRIDYREIWGDVGFGTTFSLSSRAELFFDGDVEFGLDRGATGLSGQTGLRVRF